MQKSATLKSSAIVVIQVVCWMLGCPFMLRGQNYNWAAPLIGTGTPTIGNLTPGFSGCYGVEKDSRGYVYITGYLNDSVDFDPGPGQVYLQGGNDDIFLAKYDPLGNYEWAFVPRSAGWNYGRAIAIDENDAVYISGYISSPADFDPGAGTTQLSNAGFADAFIAKYDSSGRLQWAHNLGGSGFAAVYAMCSDHWGRIYVAGILNGDADFDPGPGTAWISSAGTDVFFAAYDELGNFLWVKDIQGAGMYATLSGIATDAFQHVYISGYFSQAADFDPGPGSVVLTPVSKDIFFAGYDRDGNFRWANSIPSAGQFTSDINGPQIAAGDSGRVVLAGSFNDTIDADPGPGVHNLVSTFGQYSGFLASFDSSGNFVWAGGLTGGFSTCTGLALDSAGYIYLAGDFAGLTDFDPGAGNISLSGTGAIRNFFARYSSNGACYWARMIGNGGAGGSITNPVIRAGRWHQYVAGFFRQVSDFDPGPDSANYTSSSLNGFVARYSVTGRLSYIHDCEGDTTHFFLSDSTALDSVHWDFGNPGSSGNTASGISSQHVFSAAQTFSVTATLYYDQGPNGVEIPVLIHPRPVVKLPDSLKICRANAGTLDAGNPGSSYVWQDGSTGQKMNVIDSGLYHVEVINVNGCRSGDSTYVTLLDEEKLKIPNIITPNNDGMNDYFEIRGLTQLSSDLRIFNRWGNLVFHENPYLQDWNGGDQPDGSYYFLMNTSGSCALELKGVVEVLR